MFQLFHFLLINFITYRITASKYIIFLQNMYTFLCYHLLHPNHYLKLFISFCYILFYIKQLLQYLSNYPFYWTNYVYVYKWFKVCKWKDYCLKYAFVLERRFFYILLKKLRDSETLGLQDFSFFLSSTFVYKPIFIKKKIYEC